MKKLLAALVALVAINASAYDVTNTVTIVSNIYNRISEEHWITNNIKNTHTNYHYTNNVYTVSNVTLLVSQTNVHTTATYDMGRSMLSIMSNDVNSAKASIRSTADEAAGSATNASAAASRASSSAASAQNTLGSVNSRGAEIINAMNAKQNWFDQNYGKMITNHNIYVAEDQVARAGVAQNAADISSLSTRMGTAETNIGNLNTSVSGLTTRMGTTETNIENLNTSVSGLTTRMGTAETNIENLNTSVSGLTTRMGTAEREVAASVAYTTAVSNKLQKSSMSKLRLDYTYHVYYQLIVYGESLWTYVGDFRVDPMSAVLTSTDASGTKIYKYNFTNDSPSQYKITVSAVYKFVPVTGTPYMVVVCDKGTSDHAEIQNPDEYVLYGSDYAVFISSSYKFSCSERGEILEIAAENDGLLPVSGGLYQQKVKVTLRNGNETVNIFAMEDKLNDYSNELSAAVSSLEGVVNAHGRSIGSLNTSVSGITTRMTAAENDISIIKQLFGSKKYKSPSGIVYDRIDVYSMATNGNKVAAYATGQKTEITTDAGSSLGYTVYLSSSWVNNPKNAANYWDVVPSFAEFSGGVVKLHFVPTARKVVNAKSETTDAGCAYLLEDFYWSDGSVYAVVTSYLDGVFRGRIRCRFADGTYMAYPYVSVSFPDSISSKMSVGTYGATMEFDSREGTIMGTASTSGLVNFKTTSGKVAAKDAPVMFPESPSMTSMINMVWYNTYGQYTLIPVF